jgi:hypothetical protein
MAAGVNGEHDFEDPFSTNPQATADGYWELQVVTLGFLISAHPIQRAKLLFPTSANANAELWLYGRWRRNTATIPFRLAPNSPAL